MSDKMTRDEKKAVYKRYLAQEMTRFLEENREKIARRAHRKLLKDIQLQSKDETTDETPLP